MKGIIYKWTCCVNGKSYIGQTTNEQRRESDFLNETKSYAGEKIDNARRKYGLTNGVWKKTVLKRLWCKNGKEDELRKRLNYWEKYYIEVFDSVKNGYNTTDGGDYNYTFDEEVIERLRKIGKENWEKLNDMEKEEHIQKSQNWWDNLSSEEKVKYKNNARNKWKEWWGNLSDEEKNKHNELCATWWSNLSEEEKEVFKKKSMDWYNSLSEAERSKIKEKSRLANLGKKNGHSIKRSQSSSLRNVGKSRDDATKKKISETLKNNETIQRNTKKVIQYDINNKNIYREYPSLTMAAKAMCVTQKTFKIRIKKGNGIYKGYYWEIYNIEPNECEDRKGCYWIERLKRWRSTIHYKGKKYSLGHFENVEAAKEMRQIAENKIQESMFEEWLEDIHKHKISLYKKYGEIIDDK